MIVHGTISKGILAANIPTSISSYLPLLAEGNVQTPQPIKPYSPKPCSPRATSGKERKGARRWNHSGAGSNRKDRHLLAVGCAQKPSTNPITLKH